MPVEGADKDARLARAKGLIEELAKRKIKLIHEDDLAELEKIVEALEAWRERALNLGESVKVFDAALAGEKPEENK